MKNEHTNTPNIYVWPSAGRPHFCFFEFFEMSYKYSNGNE